MNFLQGIEKYNSNICLVDESGKVFFYEEVLKIGEKITTDLEKRSLIFVLAHIF